MELYEGVKVQHNFSKQKGVIVDYRDDPLGYNYLVYFKIEDGKIYEDWFKEEVLERIDG